MGIFSIFRQKVLQVVSRWRELGSYQSTFSNFGSDLYKSDLVRACVRPLVDFTSKANVVCSDKQLERVLRYRPNIYMNGKAFLQKVRTLYELRNNVFIYIQRDERMRCIGLYPVPYSSFEALEYLDGLYIRFHFTGGHSDLTVPWDDLAVLRKDYHESDIAGDDNTAIIATLQLIQTTNEGVANAVKSTANLRGIIKSTKGMLSPEDKRAQKEQFVADYMGINNEGGIASLDATQEFYPVSMSPVVATAQQKKEFREDVYRYFGVNDKIVTGEADAGTLEAFYELRVEPFLVDLSTELTSKIYAGHALAFQNWVVYEANKLQFASLDKKIAVYKEIVLNGGMLINEWRAGCNLAPIEGGDEPIRRLDVAPVDDVPATEQMEDTDD